MENTIESSYEGSRRPSYGIDAPDVLLALSGIGTGCGALAYAVERWASGDLAELISGQLWIAAGAFLAGATLLVLGSRFGKVGVVRRLVDALEVKDDARVLDVGCGRGMVLIEIARRLTSGSGLAIGVDPFLRLAQSGNRRERTIENGRRADVSDRMQVREGGAEELPLEDASVEAAACSLAFQRFPDSRRAVQELHRVLRAGGRVAFLNLFWISGRCHRLLESEGFEDVRTSGPHLRMFPPVRITTARMPKA